MGWLQILVINQQMSEYYRSARINVNQLNNQLPVSPGNNRNLNRTYGPETAQNLIGFNVPSHVPEPNRIVHHTQPPNRISYNQPPPLEYRPLSHTTSFITVENSQQRNNSQSVQKSFEEMTKNFMAEMSKSIADITKAQVQAILQQKQREKERQREKYKQKQADPVVNSNQRIGQSRTLGKFKNEEGETKSSTYNRVMSLEGSIQQQKVAEKYQVNLIDLCLEEEQKKANLSSLRSNSINQYQNTLVSNQATEVLKGELRQISKQMKNLGENKKESRSIWLDINFERVPEDGERMHHLKKRVFRIMEDVLSVSFNMHYTNGMDYEKVKAYCCENFIVNFIKLVKMSKITVKDMKVLEEQLQDDMLPYLNLSYPRSEEKLVNKELKSKISEKDIFNENRFDIVNNSKVVLSTKQGESNSEIMRIMNFIIKLPDEKIPEIVPETTSDAKKMLFSKSKTLVEEQELTLFENFERDMEAILTKVYRKDLTNRLYKLTYKDEALIKLQLPPDKIKFLKSQQLIRKIDQLLLTPTFEPYKKTDNKDSKKSQMQYVQEMANITRLQLFRSVQDVQKQKLYNREADKEKEQQEQEYKEKVQSYTKFKIGRKISSNVEPYTQEEIEEGALIIKDSSVARVLMKWVEAIEDQIKDPAKSLYLRDEPFRLHNSQETYLLSTQSKIKELYQFYRRSSKVVEQKAQIIKNNARQIFLEAIKSAEQNEKFKQYREFSSQNDAEVGHICTILQKSRQNHVSSYLNMLLGEIKYIEQEYQWQIEDKRIDLPSRPSFINMRLGDLMRCQITSKPKQIVALYQYIAIICSINPERFQLVRVKDRLSTPNKDILINIFYYKKIMIEIQLAIKNQSAFISCSDRFSHFIYELERALLGPINEMCSIWSQYSPKSDFFLRKFTEINIRPRKLNKVELQCMHFYQDEEKDLKLPFRCFSCEVLYYNGSIPRKKCSNCGIYECCICTIKSNEQEFVAKQLPEYQIKKEREIGKIFYALDIVTSHRHVKALLKLEINGKMEAYSMKLEIGEDGSVVVSNIKSEYEIKKRNRINFKREIFDQSHIILQKKDRKKQEQENKLINEVIKQILNQHYLPRRTKVIIKKSQSFMKLTLITNPKVEDATKGQIITDIINKSSKLLVLIEKLNLNENGLSDLQIAGKMPNAKNVVLNHNNLTSLDLFGFRNLVTLQLSHNNIESFARLKHLNQCQNLKRLMLDYNHITQVSSIPNSLLKLECLSLCRNKITNLNRIPQLLSLRSINLNENRLNDLTGIQKLTKLQQLRLKQNSNLANSGVDLIKDLRELKKLDLSHTNLKQTLQQSRNMLKDTITLHHFNYQASSSQNSSQYKPLHAIQSLTQLQELNASSNALKYVPRIPELSKLKELNLSNNVLKDTKNLQSFLNLKWLCLSNNQISSIKHLEALKNLYWLDLSFNKITSPDLRVISSLKNLHEIQLSNNQLMTLDGIGQLPKLYELSCRCNKLKSLKGIQKLISLEHFDTRDNRQLKHLFGINNLQVLFELKLSGCRLKDIDDLASIQRLKILELNRCNISKIAFIPRLKNLQELYLNQNKIQTLDGIKMFESLKKLQIVQNQKLSFEESDFSKLKSLSNIFFSLNQNINLEFIGHSESLEIIRIHKKKDPTVEQNNNLITLSLIGYNIQFVEVKERQFQYEDLEQKGESVRSDNESQSLAF